MSIRILPFLFAPVVCAAPAEHSNIYEDFEGAEIFQVNPNSTSDDVKFLWNQYDNIYHAGPGTESISSEEAFSGESSLKITVDSGNLQAQFYPYSSEQYKWLYVSEAAADGLVQTTTWQNDRYNRMKFWAKVPEGVDRFTGGRSNFIWGTYTRCTTCDVTSAESGNGHWYHNFNIMHTGQWHQFIVDFHPNHQRGEGGNDDQGVVEYPTGEAGLNYFDVLTRFYFDIEDIPAPFTFYFDKIEFYYDPNDENVEEIYSLNGVYRPSDNYLYVGWMRHKAHSHNFEVRYSFNDIHDLGWNSATPAPNGLVSPLGGGGYNAIEYETDGIDMSGRSQIYVAIKPKEQDRFRQIVIPISAVGYKSPPVPPGSFNGRVN